MMRVLSLLTVAIASGAAYAAPFNDPTMPPNAPAQGAESGIAGPGGPAAVSGARLESVLIAPNRRVAVISGKSIPLGGKYGTARIVSITESKVVLQDGEKKETLLLYPGVEKKSVGTKARRANRTDR